MMSPKAAALYLSVFLLPASIFGQSADVKHFWDFESSYEDKVGPCDGSVTVGTLDTDGSPSVFPGGAPQVVTGHGGVGSGVEFGIYQPSLLVADHNRVQIDGASIFQPGRGAFSVSAWVNFADDSVPTGTGTGANTSENPARGILEFSADGKDGFHLLYGRSNGLITARVDGPPSTTTTGGVVVSAALAEDEEWHLVVVTYDPLDGAGFKIYVDGTSGATSSAGPVSGNPVIPLDPAPYLGAFNLKASGATDANNNRNGMAGKLDDVAIYSGILSPAEIDGLFAGTIQPSDVVFVPAPPAAVGHYWDFDTLNGPASEDLFGDFDLADAPLGFANIGSDFIYGEAFTGAGDSLNMLLSDTNYMVADTWDETNMVPLALDFGTGDFAISYWVWDSSDGVNGDADVRTACVLDCLAGTATGVQISTTVEGYFNLRLDDDAGNSFVSSANALVMPPDQWVQVTVNVDRGADLAKVYFNGAEVGSYDISVLTGKIVGSQDLQVGVINGGAAASQAQKCGIDDVAFYPRALSLPEITGLATATTTPLIVLNTVPAGAAEIVSYSRDAVTGESTLVWKSAIGVSYSVWGSPDLLNWTELTPPGGVAGTGLNLSLMDTPALSPGRYFYQIRTE